MSKHLNTIFIRPPFCARKKQKSLGGENRKFIEAKSDMRIIILRCCFLLRALKDNQLNINLCPPPFSLLVCRVEESF